MVEVFVRQFRERGVQPVPVFDDPLLRPCPERFQLPAGGGVVLVEVHPLSRYGSTPPASGTLEPRLPRRLTSHDRTSHRLEKQCCGRPDRSDPPHGFSVRISVWWVGLSMGPSGAATQLIVPEGFRKSGRLDLNQRPLGPEPSALARLSYAPSS